MYDINITYIKYVVWCDDHWHRRKQSFADALKHKCFFNNLAKFTRKHQCRGLFLKKLYTALATLLKKRLWDRCFAENFVKFLRTPFLQNTANRTCQNCQILLEFSGQQTISDISLLLSAYRITDQFFLLQF